MDALIFYSLISDASGFKDEFLSWKSWRSWCVRILHNISPYTTTPYFEGQDDPNGESPAVEVLNHNDPKGYFAGIYPIYSYRLKDICLKN